MKTKTPPDADILDWTVSDAEFADTEAVEVLEDSAPLPAARPAQSAFRFDWKLARAAALPLVGTSLAVLFFVAAYNAWQNYSLRQALIPRVAAEDEARLSGDAEALREFLDDNDTAWKYDQLASGQTFPAALAWPLPEVGEVKAVTRFSPEIVRVDVERPYSDQPDYGYYGYQPQRQKAYSFIQPQFYRFQAEAWKRIRPPEDFFGPQRVVWSGRIEWKFSTVDSDLIEAVRPQVERALETACGLWNCPAEFGMTVTFLSRTVSSNFYNPLPTAPEDSRLLSYYQNDNGMVYSTNTLITYSPHLLGVPADAATQTLFEHNLTLGVLANALHRLNTAREGQRNVLWMALAARLTSKFEFENQRYRELLAPEPLTPLDELWETRMQRNGGQPPNLLRDAQILLNRLLRTLPPEAETQLLAALPYSENAEDWLVKALDFTPAEAATRWKAVLEPMAIAPTATQPAAYALHCPSTTGLSLWEGGEAKPYAALPPSVSSVAPVSWSPDGQRLIVRVGPFGESLGVVDFAARRVLWLPNSSGWPNAQWLSNTRLAYNSTSTEAQIISSAYNPGQSQLALFDTERPEAGPTLIPEVNFFMISPNREYLAVTGLADNAYGDRIGLLSAAGGEVRWLDEGSGGLWTADSQHLLYSTHGLTPTLKVLAAKTETSRVLLNREIISPLLPLTFTVQSFNALSMEDDFVYFAAYGDQSAFNGSASTLLGRIKLDGSGLQKLFLATQAWANFMGLFEDKNYFLVAAQNYANSFSSFLVIETATGNIARTIEGYTQLWYNPVPFNSGGVMMVNQQGKIFSLREPFGELEPHTSPAALNGCGEAMRNPAFGGP